MCLQKVQIILAVRRLFLNYELTNFVRIFANNYSRSVKTVAKTLKIKTEKVFFEQDFNLEVFRILLFVPAFIEKTSTHVELESF